MRDEIKKALDETTGDLNIRLVDGIIDISLGAEAYLEDGWIKFRVHTSALQSGADGAYSLGEFSERILVTDPDMFAKELVRVLNKEDENGTSRLHTLLDEAVWEAYTDGAEGVESHPDQTLDGAFPDDN